MYGMKRVLNMVLLLLLLLFRMRQNTLKILILIKTNYKFIAIRYHFSKQAYISDKDKLERQWNLRNNGFSMWLWNMNKPGECLLAVLNEQYENKYFFAVELFVLFRSPPLHLFEGTKLFFICVILKLENAKNVTRKLTNFEKLYILFLSMWFFFLSSVLNFCFYL